MADNAVFSLSDAEEKWWDETIRTVRNEIIHPPKDYVELILQQEGVTKEILSNNIEAVLRSLREKVWQLYLVDEAKFHAEIMSSLIRQRDLPRSILSEILDASDLVSSSIETNSQIFVDELAKVIGDFSGRTMPYIYALSLSTTQSRRSRAGKVFEAIIESFFDVYGYPYVTQSAIGRIADAQYQLGKKVDVLVPSVEAYQLDRMECAVVTMKTTLRERWQEVAEELSRTNIPRVYLLTLDETITPQTVKIMNNHNIKLVVYKSIKEGRLQEFSNVKHFEEFFDNDLSRIISHWNPR